MRRMLAGGALLMLAIAGLNGCSSPQSAATPTCGQVAASQTEYRLPAPPVTQLAGTIRIDTARLQPAPASYRPTVSEADAWARNQLVQEKLASYQVVLARVWQPNWLTSRLTPEPYFHGQVFWVIVGRGLAGTPGAGPPPPAGHSPHPQPSCVFFPTGMTVVDPTTGHALVSTG